MHEGQAKCGAATRSGAPCKDISMANGRCKRHGGKSTGAKVPNTGPANKAATKFSIYSRYLSDEDREIYDSAELGNVEHELRLVRMRLARTVRARKMWEDSLAAPVNSDGEEHQIFVETVEDQALLKEGGVVDLTKRIKRLPDFDKIEHACLARIESLEKTRRELLKAPDEDPDSEPGTTRVTITGGLPPRGA